MKNIFITTIFLLLLLFSLIGTTRPTVPTITYFPPDDSVHFTEIVNDLSFTKNRLVWRTASTTNKQTYLRQDIALLYVDGYFTGFLNAWEHNGQTIEFEQVIDSPLPGRYESIAYHYSETQNNLIRSRAMMSGSTLCVHCKRVSLHITEQLLLNKWDELIDYFSIDEDRFHILALSDLLAYADQPLSPYSQEKTDEIIEHLWEGLYANYIVPIMSIPEGERGHFIPVILYNEDELHILYEVDGQKEQLIQQLSI